MPRYSTIVSLRVTFEEEAAVRAAAAAMDVGSSALVELATLNAAHRLGLFEDSAAAPSSHSAKWDALPDRGDETTSSKFNVSLTQNAFDLARRAADWLGTSPPMFMIGSTLRYIAAMQTRAEGKNRALARVVLPAQYARRPANLPPPVDPRRR